MDLQELGVVIVLLLVVCWILEHLGAGPLQQPVLAGQQLLAFDMRIDYGEGVEAVVGVRCEV
jgi:hypothetical protein